MEFEIFESSETSRDIHAEGQYLSASCTSSVMRSCGTGEEFVSVYTERRLVMASRKDIVDAIMGVLRSNFLTSLNRVEQVLSASYYA